MKQLLISLILVCGAPLAARTIFVSAAGSPASTGDNWNVSTTLTKACALATEGDHIWVAKGTYRPGQERSSTFLIPAGVKVYGGFSGTETALNQRLLSEATTTVLSGNIGAPNDREDNVFTVVTMINAGGETVLDGFLISGGEARDFVHAMTTTTAGGALYIKGGRNGQGPNIANCIFTNNKARHGGAVYVQGKHAPARPSFSNCVFNTNVADFNGGAVYNDGTGGEANSIFEACTFTNNTSDLGACLLNEGTNGESNPILVGCTFTNNLALTDGAVIYNIVEGTNGTADHVLNSCHREANKSTLGKDISSNYKVNQPVPNTGGQPIQRGSSLSPVN